MPEIRAEHPELSDVELRRRAEQQHLAAITRRGQP
jgi:hypothetical protein